ncbi:hypothetical protein B0H14DRAFT_2222177, partial [Mycena olivaceomarginata]
WPKWLADGHTLLSACPEDGSKWKEVVETWVQLEKAYGFKTSTSNILSEAKARPEEVHQWIKYGRSTTCKTKVNSHDVLVAKWWKWWSGLTPAWRNKDKEGRPEVGEKVGEWGVLVHLGANGILTILLPLVWWREGEAGEAASESWLAAVQDVLCVLQGL